MANVIKNFGPVVQLVRIPACHAGGREFESRPDRKSLPPYGGGLLFFLILGRVASAFFKVGQAASLLEVNFKEVANILVE